MLILWAKGFLELVLLFNRTCGDQYGEPVCQYCTLKGT